VVRHRLLREAVDALYLPRGAQGWVGWGFGQPGLVVGPLPMAGGLEVGDLYMFPPNPSNYLIL